MYGGSNSHMTIRCSELNVTAVIGVGHKSFSEIKLNSIIQINPKQKNIKPPEINTKNPFISNTLYSEKTPKMKLTNFERFFHQVSWLF